MACVGEFAGEYIARCATGECEYIGEFSSILFEMFLDVSPSVCLERFYNSRGLVVGEYPRHSKSLLFSFFWPEFSSNHLATKHST